MDTQTMPIFSRTFDLLAWLLPATNHFPRAHRHSLTSRLLHATFDLRERLEEANIHRGSQRLEHLRKADASLATVRMYLRLAHQLTWLSVGQYQHVSSMVVEVGRLLGGWQKTVNSSS
jgi:four helix bundle protein